MKQEKSYMGKRWVLFLINIFDWVFNDAIEIQGKRSFEQLMEFPQNLLRVTLYLLIVHSIHGSVYKGVQRILSSVALSNT